MQVAFGDGFRCAGGVVTRLPVVNAGVNGTPTFLIDMGALPFGAGTDAWQSVNFQWWTGTRTGRAPTATT